MRIGMARRWAALTLALAVAALLGGNAALAQDQSIPPWPILFQGTALLNGEPVQEGTLTVRVGDWESPRPTPVSDGIFDCGAACLIAGPPSLAYLDLPVTFHLDGERQATLSFTYPYLGTPCLVEVELLFGDDAWPCGYGEPVPVGRRAASYAYAHAAPGDPDANRRAAGANVCADIRARAHSGACGRSNLDANPSACAHGRNVVRRRLRHTDSHRRRRHRRHRSAGHRRHKARAQASVEGRSLLP